jgi:hypothetical protein
MTTQNYSPKQLAVFGEFLRLGYAEIKNLDRLIELSVPILSKFEISHELAIENRIWTNIIAIFVETPLLYRSLSSTQQAVFKENYMRNWRYAELIKRQLTEISAHLASSNAGPILMIKGGLRLYDGLYPTLAHRYMADLDLVFTDKTVLAVCANLGYQFDDISGLNLTNVSQEYLDWQKTQDHHLPPIHDTRHPMRLEMHQHLVHLRAVNFCRSRTLERGCDISGLPHILAPNICDQMILNILHTKYGDMYTDYSNFRLRNIFEGYLIFQKLSTSERFDFEQHFASINRHDDVVFWKYLCYQMLDAQEFSGKYPMRIKLKFLLHARFGQNSRANAIIYSIHFLYRLIGADIWSSQGRTKLWLKLKDGSVRGRFWQKIKRIVKS